MDTKALYKLTYGLFLLTANADGRDNGCIINTAVQLTDTPKRITIAVNKANYTHDMIMKTGVFNVCVLSRDAQFAQFQQFGFRSGRDADKFAGYDKVERSDNGVLYITENTNAVISAKVIETKDYGTHTLFVADVTATGKNITAGHFQVIVNGFQPVLHIHWFLIESVYLGDIKVGGNYFI